MTDKTLTDAEKEALLEGVSSGAVEVQSSDGARYASVKAFEFGPRSRIVSNSYPRLQLLNHQMAELLSLHASSMVQRDVHVQAVALRSISFSEFSQLHEELCFANTFNAPPLDGSALVTLDTGLVRNLVECFFGGDADGHAVANDKSFTAGEAGVARLFCNVILSTLKEVMAPISEISPDPIATNTNLELVEVAVGSEPVIACEFEITFGEQNGIFRLMWPVATVRPLIPVFEGQKKERDKARDLLWARELRRRITDSTIELTTNVGHAGLKLSDLLGLAPGDTIGIENPSQATVYAKQVPILQGRFGVHGGRNAVETLEWLRANETTRT